MRPILCLDCQAFTKVALRRIRRPSSLVEAPSLNFDEMKICVPTLVATVMQAARSGPVASRLWDKKMAAGSKSTGTETKLSSRRMSPHYATEGGRGKRI